MPSIKDIRQLKEGVKFTKVYVGNIRKKVSDMRTTTLEDMESLRETMSVIRDTAVALRGSASKEDMQNFRETMKSMTETMVAIRDTVESVRRTVETVKEILLIAQMLKSGQVSLESKQTETSLVDNTDAKTKKVPDTVKVE